MSRLARNAATAVHNPALVWEYAGWALQKIFNHGVPARIVHGVELGNFNGFSEYHSVRGGVLPDELAFISRYPFGEGAIIDIGANLGLFSLLVNKRFPSRRTIAFEPNPSTFEALQNNIRRNRADGIKCHQMAITDREGAVTFSVREHARANASIIADDSIATDAIRVACTTLDKFCQAHVVGRIALLKVDVEGYETLVFRGAENVLLQNRPGIIYFEVCPGLTQAACIAPDEPARYVADRGYALHRFAANGQLQPVEARAAADVARVENWIGIDAQ